ncbi:hypothetical protein Agub_g11023, partial [Astrephomene gubernaculifera]
TTDGSKPSGVQLTEELTRVAGDLGRSLARLHDGGQVLGGVGPASVILRAGDGAVVLADFRCSHTSSLALDKARDLVELEAVLLRLGGDAAGSRGEQERGQEQREAEDAGLARAMFERVLATYRSSSRFWSATHNKLPEARAKLLQQQQQQQQQANNNKRSKLASEPAATDNGNGLVSAAPLAG